MRLSDIFYKIGSSFNIFAPKQNKLMAFYEMGSRKALESDWNQVGEDIGNILGTTGKQNKKLNYYD